MSAKKNGCETRFFGWEPHSNIVVSVNETRCTVRVSNNLITDKEVWFEMDHDHAVEMADFLLREINAMRERFRQELKLMKEDA